MPHICLCGSTTPFTPSLPSPSPPFPPLSFFSRLSTHAALHTPSHAFAARVCRYDGKRVGSRAHLQGVSTQKDKRGCAGVLFSVRPGHGNECRVLRGRWPKHARQQGGSFRGALCAMRVMGVGGESGLLGGLLVLYMRSRHSPDRQLCACVFYRQNR